MLASQVVALHTALHHTLFKIYFHLKNRVTGRKGGTEIIFHPLIHSPNGCSDWNCASPVQSQDPGSSSGSPMWCRGPRTWPLLHCLKHWPLLAMAFAKLRQQSIVTYEHSKVWIQMGKKSIRQSMKTKNNSYWILSVVPGSQFPFWSVESHCREKHCMEFVAPQK